MAITETHVVSGTINVGNSPTVIVSGHVQVDNFPTTSVSGNVVNISGQHVIVNDGQIVVTSVSGNVLQASISGDILVTSFSGNVVNFNNLSPPISSTNYVFVNTGFVVPQNTSGGVDLPNIGTFSSGLPIAFLMFSGMTQPNIRYGTSGYTYVNVPGVVTNPSEVWIGSIRVLNPAAGQNSFTGPNPATNTYPFTNTSQIKIISDVSGATLVYGGFI